MEKMQPTAVFFYNPKGAVPDPIDYNELASYVLKFPFVKQVWKADDFLWNEENLLSRIEMYQLERIIIAGPVPGIMKTSVFKGTVPFRKRSGKCHSGQLCRTWNPESD